MNKSKIKKSTAPHLTPNLIFRGVSFMVLTMVLLVITIFISYQLAYRHRIYPGIKISNINIGNKTIPEAKELLSKPLQVTQKNGISFSFSGEVKTFTLTDLGVNYDLDQALREAYLIGRHPNLFISLDQKLKAWTHFYNLSPQFSFDNQKFTSALEFFNSKIARAPQEAKINFQKGEFSITPPRAGQNLDMFAAKNNLQTSLRTFSTNPIILEQKTIQPDLTEAEVEIFRDQITTLLKTPIKLTYESKKWEIKEEELAKMISFSGSTPNQQLTIILADQEFEISDITIDRPSEKGSGQIVLNQNEVQNFISKIAIEIDQEPVDAKFNFEGGRVAQFSSHKDGQKLDTQDAITQINQSFADRQNSSQGSEIALKVAITKAAITTESVNNLGIKELIGSGVSKFAGSIPNRQANVGLAASRVNGTLVAPGEVFSMYKAIGEVEASTGYKEAYIISKGRTQLDFGGGVCQVSTTLFRAALNTGLPIVERHPHAYRVGYYEQNSGAGIDASVFFPYSDFRFKNDTDHHLLIQTKFNPSAATLTFEFYGTRDGRSVTTTKPTLSNLTPAPPEIHQDDPTLPAGVVKQVDFAAAGATASFNRTVTKNGVILHKDTFYSKYAPWQAIFLHGTKVG